MKIVFSFSYCRMTSCLDKMMLDFLNVFWTFHRQIQLIHHLHGIKPSHFKLCVSSDIWWFTLTPQNISHRYKFNEFWRRKKWNNSYKNIILLWTSGRWYVMFVGPWPLPSLTTIILNQNFIFLILQHLQGILRRINGPKINNRKVIKPNFLHNSEKLKSTYRQIVISHHDFCHILQIFSWTIQPFGRQFAHKKTLFILKLFVLKRNLQNANCPSWFLSFIQKKRLCLGLEKIHPMGVSSYDMVIRTVFSN